MNSSSNIPNYIKEYSDFQFNISLIPDNSGEREEQIKSVIITPQITRDSVNISTGPISTVSGVYREIFDLGENAIKAIRRSDKVITGYQKFNQLPKDNSSDVFEFKPPRVLDFPIQFTVTCVYDIKITSQQQQDSGQGQSVQYIRDQQYQKTYSTVIKGSWDIWANAFREHLRNYKQ